MPIALFRRSPLPALCIGLGASALQPGCRSESSKALPSAGESTATATPLATSVARESLPPARLPLVAKGFERLPHPVLASAQKANSAALLEHQQQHWEAARAGFERALQLDPTYDLARYNLACALARLERFSDVVSELELLLQRDLPRFGARLSSDRDLAQFRASAIGNDLLARMQTLQTSWLQRARGGVRVNAWIAHVPGEGEAEYQRPEHLRGGVWLADERRFLALGSEHSDQLMFNVDPSFEFALSLRGQIDPCSSDFCPHLGKILLERIDLFDEGAAPNQRIKVGEEGYPASWLGVEAVPGGLRWRMPIFDPDDWQELGPKLAQPKPAAQRRWFTAERIELTPLGALIAGSPTGWSADHKAVVTPSGVRVEPRPELGDSFQIAQLPDGKHALLVANDVHCECEHTEDSILRHRISIIDMTSGKLRGWSSGEGAASVRIGPDGSVYLQRDQGLERYRDLAHLDAVEA
ncbi:MAG TPA: hypothetical protein VHM70_00005, partial [Polyangiaceae bacterium]|nr:hypothetical protein [Polyangiaceae bacterium]